ncbi:serine/threonine-protein kinase, partial [Actinocorallia lasiicapitis]
AEGLRAIHAAGLVHRDLKPGNIIVASDGPRIIDFGIARALDAATVTATGMMLGTVPYMSPEQLNLGEIGPASDIFSLGGVLAFAATGQAPFDAPSVGAMVLRITLQEPDLSGVPADLLPTLTHCLAKDPAARPTPTQLTTTLSQPPPAGPTPGQPAPAQLSAALSQPTPGQPTPSQLAPVQLAPGQPAPGQPATGQP